jgi:hypothetical protein
MSGTVLLGCAAFALLLAAAIGYTLPAFRRRGGQPANGHGLSEEPRDPAFTWSATTTLPVVTQVEGERALGYTTFPERKRAVSPEGRYQARRISAACEARGMVLHKLVGDVESYSGPDMQRPGLNHALDLLSAGEATCLVVAGLDRLSTSAANLGTVIEWLDQIGARLIVIDIDLDTHTEEGRVASRALVRVGALERQGLSAPRPEPPAGLR